jgi:hypothetical protein
MRTAANSFANSTAFITLGRVERRNRPHWAVPGTALRRSASSRERGRLLARESPLALQLHDLVVPLCLGAAGAAIPFAIELIERDVGCGLSELHAGRGGVSRVSPR